MKLNNDQFDSLLEAARPLIKWLNDNCHPHCEVIVGPGSAELVEGIARQVTTEYIKD